MTDTLIAALAVRYPDVIPHLSNKARYVARLEFKAMPAINREYHDAITSALTSYFEGGGIATPRREFRQACLQAFGDAFDLGYTDNGGELPIDSESDNWFQARLQQEIDQIDVLFDEAKQLRKQTDFDYFAWVTARADGYTSTLGEIYNAGAMWADKKQMLTWRLGETEKHCKTCLKLDGGSHRAAWYLSRDYIPRKPGAAMDCQGYNCDCRLEDTEGNEVTI